MVHVTLFRIEYEVEVRVVGHLINNIHELILVVLIYSQKQTHAHAMTYTAKRTAKYGTWFELD